MTTTAHPPFSLETTATDAMDLHSEPELDFDDGDIELDLDPAPPVQRDDDDVSIKDATEDATEDAMLETQTVPADQDDFMFDDVDLVGEDDLQFGNKELPAPLQSSTTVAMQDHVPTPVEEDLIDYSDDDEDEQPAGYQNEQTDPDTTQIHSAEEEHLDLKIEQTQEDHLDIETEQAPGEHLDLQTQEIQEDYHELQTEQTQGDQFGLQTEQPQEEASASDLFDGNNVTEDNEHAEEELEHHLYMDSFFEKNRKTSFEGSRQGSSQSDFEDGGVALEDPEGLLNGSDHEPDTHEEQQSIDTRTITVNYEGNELWLFKQHDTEDSGDWLLEDAQIFQSSLSALFQACRASLGEDISADTELGLRFDHFHNMEIFEDSTACVAVSLERLVDLYHVLNAQDGNSNPESFYMCLLSRPRFAALLSDVAKHAEQGSGYSGLNAAIAAGETHFVDGFSSHSTEHDTTEWENEKVADEENHEDSETYNEAEPAAEYAEHDGQNDDESGGSDGDRQADTKPEHDEEHDEDTVYGEVNDHSTALEVAEYDEGPTHDDNVSSNTNEELQLENDTVDYSDADEQDEEDAPQISTSHAPSPSSTTVQGDHPVAGEVTSRIAGDSSNDVPISAENDGESHQDYVDPLDEVDEEDAFQEFQADATETYPTEPDFDGFTNQDEVGYDYQDPDQQAPENFLNGADLNDAVANQSTTVANDIADGDDFLDLDNASEWVTDQELTSKVADSEAFLHDEFTLDYEEEEDGVAEQPAVAASTAADPVAASSLDLQETSPQGQKRSIDEVGDSVGDALDTSGKSFVLVLPSCAGADVWLPDIKRPRM
jgi:hypothetical protein